MVRLDLIQRTMERETTTNIIVLDACRDNPLARNLARAMGTRSMDIGRGLAAVESGNGTLISFSTQPGNVALDGSGRNSPFAAALLKHVGAAADDLTGILINVRNDVVEQTSGRQVPWEHSAMTARFFFSPARASADQEAELALWNSAKESNDPRQLRAYLRLYPQGAFAGVAQNLVNVLETQQRLVRLAEQERQKREAELRDLESAVQKAREAANKWQATTAVASLPSVEANKGANFPFDGNWAITRVGASCKGGASATFNVSISNGHVSDGRGIGKVAASGDLSLQRSSNRSGRTMHFSGSLRGNSGSGTFYTDGGHCQGTFTAQRT